MQFAARVFEDAATDGGEEVGVQDFLDARPSAAIAERVGNLADGGVTVSGRSFTEDLSDDLEHLRAAGLINRHRGYRGTIVAVTLDGVSAIGRAICWTLLCHP